MKQIPLFRPSYDHRELNALKEPFRTGWLGLGPKTKEFEIVGGAKHFKRIKNLDSPDYLERVDGCWFDFSIMIVQSNQSVEIIGFDFEIRFLDDVSVKFFRIDFNLPGHENEDLGMRFHLHPGNDDFMVHALPMSPIEILNLFLYGFDIPKKQRSS